jgi:hypothetical protein
MMRLLVSGIVLLACVRVAHAYPQFQLVKDATCTSCHLSPSGDGLLSENGLSTAENISQWGTAPEFFYNKLPLPSWLELGGDLRGASGYDSAGAPNHTAVLFPMQGEVYAAATYKSFSLHLTGGVRDPRSCPLDDPNCPSPASTLFFSREHWVQWQQDPGATDGLFVRVGRFMPVFGLRFAEHPDYDRRYGGSPLYDETYAAALEYIQPAWEVHATAFIKDPIAKHSVERGNGAALYAEARLTDATLVGVEGKLDVTPDDSNLYTGVTAKQLIRKDLVVEAEVELVHQTIHPGAYTVNQIVGTAVGSYFRGPFMIDLGFNIFQKNLDFIILEQEAYDLNVHWFATSHLELLLTNRIESLAFGADGGLSGYTLLQVHYRL